MKGVLPEHVQVVNCMLSGSEGFQPDLGFSALHRRPFSLLGQAALHKLHPQDGTIPLRSIELGDFVS